MQGLRIISFSFKKDFRSRSFLQQSSNSLGLLFVETIWGTSKLCGKKFPLMMLLCFCNLAPFPQSSCIGENKKLGQVFVEEKLRQCRLSDLGYALTTTLVTLPQGKHSRKLQGFRILEGCIMHECVILFFNSSYNFSFVMQPSSNVLNLLCKLTQKIKHFT